MTALRGTLDLSVPEDLFDVMVPEDPEEARAVFRDLFSRMFPRAGAHDLGVLTDGLLAWRRRLRDSGVVLHGIVALPASETGATPAHWHFFAGVVDVPEAGELDAGVVAARYLGDQLEPDRAYTEAYETDMGWGVGVITEVPLQPGDLPPDLRAAAGAGEPTALPPVLGLAAAIAAAPDSRHGLLVVGLCLDVERTLEMAAVVASVAGTSVVHVEESGAVDGTP
ncbi:hypothetical protein CLV56_3071 [Mumia flava]|uniref:Uncharacterized protein n=1 Tax=Mumia flava TaxID=1348852 RepID=A0A0B2B3Z4_9ACTN|nr:hypothetical protein [Mumia flava]PJJ53581.1 hypothetical protein CLV56_3071 [Mumia flava]